MSESGDNDKPSKTRKTFRTVFRSGCRVSMNYRISALIIFIFVLVTAIAIAFGVFLQRQNPTSLIPDDYKKGSDTNSSGGPSEGGERIKPTISKCTCLHKTRLDKSIKNWLQSEGTKRKKDGLITISYETMNAGATFDTEFRCV